jgi:hypothetical protein
MTSTKSGVWLKTDLRIIAGINIRNGMRAK